MTDESPLHKADFDSIYDQPDPRAYYSTLGPLDYAIPGHGAGVFTDFMRVRAAGDGRPSQVLDVCCSYGVVGMLLKTDLPLADVYTHYEDPTKRSLSSDEMVEVDRTLMEQRRRAGAPSVIGLDVAEHAVDYAVRTGALDAGRTENLEVDDPSAELDDLLSGVDLVTTTGGVGYVTERTFDRILESTSDSAWVAAFCLRTYDYAPISETLAQRGRHTEHAVQTFPQRRFTDQAEQEWAVSQVETRGLDPAGREADGYYHAEFFLSRPEADVARFPLGELLPGLA